MFAPRKYRRAIAAGLLYLLLLSDMSYAQDTCLSENLAASTASITLPSDSAFCAQDEEPAPLALRVLFARESCESLPRAGWAHDICARNSGAALSCTNEEQRIHLQLLAMGRRGETIARIRQQVLEILQNNDACAAWYQLVDPDAAATFRSLVFVLDEKGPPYVYSLRDAQDALHLKHPYVASAMENAGRNSAIQLNVNGAFFNRSSSVIEEPPDGGPARPVGMRTLRVDSYPGATPEAQLTAMLHELGHIVGRIPEDSDSLDGQSARNTAEVLRHCRPEIRDMARKNHH